MLFEETFLAAQHISEASMSLATLGQFSGTCTHSGLLLPGGLQSRHQQHYPSNQQAPSTEEATGSASLAGTFPLTTTLGVDLARPSQFYNDAGCSITSSTFSPSVQAIASDSSALCHPGSSSWAPLPICSPASVTTSSAQSLSGFWPVRSLSTGVSSSSVSTGLNHTPDSLDGVTTPWRLATGALQPPATWYQFEPPTFCTVSTDGSDGESTGPTPVVQTTVSMDSTLLPGQATYNSASDHHHQQQHPWLLGALPKTTPVVCCCPLGRPFASSAHLGLSPFDMFANRGRAADSRMEGCASGLDFRHVASAQLGPMTSTTTSPSPLGATIKAPLASPTSANIGQLDVYPDKLTMLGRTEAPPAPWLDKVRPMSLLPANLASSSSSSSSSSTAGGDGAEMAEATATASADPWSRHGMDLHAKPPFSYITLIVSAMNSKLAKQITLNEIYSWIMSNFAYYRKNTRRWQNSIRHALSFNDCFVKVPRPSGEAGKGAYWTLHPHAIDMFQNGSSMRRNRKFIDEARHRAVAASMTVSTLKTAANGQCLSSQSTDESRIPSSVVTTIPRPKGCRARVSFTSPNDSSGSLALLSTSVSRSVPSASPSRLSSSLSTLYNCSASPTSPTASSSGSLTCTYSSTFQPNPQPPSFPTGTSLPSIIGSSTEEASTGSSRLGLQGSQRPQHTRQSWLKRVVDEYSLKETMATSASSDCGATALEATTLSDPDSSRYLPRRTCEADELASEDAISLGRTSEFSDWWFLHGNLIQPTQETNTPSHHAWSSPPPDSRISQVVNSTSCWAPHEQVNRDPAPSCYCPQTGDSSSTAESCCRAGSQEETAFSCCFHLTSFTPSSASTPISSGKELELDAFQSLGQGVQTGSSAFSRTPCPSSSSSISPVSSLSTSSFSPSSSTSSYCSSSPSSSSSSSSSSSLFSSSSSSVSSCTGSSPLSCLPTISNRQAYSIAFSEPELATIRPTDGEHAHLDGAHTNMHYVSMCRP